MKKVNMSAEYVGALEPGQGFKYRETGAKYYAMAAADKKGNMVRCVGERGGEFSIPWNTPIIPLAD